MEITGWTWNKNDEEDQWTRLDNASSAAVPWTAEAELEVPEGDDLVELWDRRGEKVDAEWAGAEDS